MRHVSISAVRRYDVVIGVSLSLCGDSIRSLTGSERICVVTDSHVAPFYLDCLLQSLAQAGCEAISYVIPAGESSKNAGEYLKLLEFLVSQEFTRADAIAALGGGVVGDLAGFAAATYMRGLPFVQLPTTLLAMVDASVGGKTAIDLPGGKNLCGCFYQPWGVLCDCQTLETLPDDVFSAGCAEIIKCGILQDPEILRLVTQNPKEHIPELIERCVRVKGALVERDEQDLGLRQLLNFGHTVGHAIESKSQYTVSHGFAVALGMLAVTEAAVAHGDCEANVLFALKNALEHAGLPSTLALLPHGLSLRMDKKRRGDQITLVVPEALGRCVCKTFTFSSLHAYLNLPESEDIP